MPMLRWANRRQPLIAIAIWTPVLLLSTAWHAAEAGAGRASWLGLAVIAATNVAAIVASMRRRWPSEPFFVAQAAATVALTMAEAGDWYALYVLLALGANAALRARLVPAAVLATSGAWAAVDTSAAPWSELWVTTLLLLLTGFGTFMFVQLFATIEELNATRDALARNAVTVERERFARDLHDLLGHSLSLIVVKAQAVRRLLPDQREAAADHAADIESIGRQALDDVRAAVRGYRETTFGAEVERAQDALRSADVELAVAAPALPVARGQDALLGWAVREATTNVLRHSTGRHCRIDLTRHDDRLMLSIHDDGDAAAYEPGSGLSGLRERFVEAGGEFDAGPGVRGFTVTAALPATTRVRS